MFHSPPDLQDYAARGYFPTEADKLISDTTCDGGFNGAGCWNITYTSRNKGGNGTDVDEQLRDGVVMPSCSCSSQEPVKDDLLAGMVQRVVAAVLNGTAHSL